MNIEEARKVLWLKSKPRPLGELLDEGYLTRDRLEWAGEGVTPSVLWTSSPKAEDSTGAFSVTDQWSIYEV